MGVLFGWFGREIKGPGLPSGSIIYQGHLFSKKDTYVFAFILNLPSNHSFQGSFFPRSLQKVGRRTMVKTNRESTPRFMDLPGFSIISPFKRTTCPSLVKKALTKFWNAYGPFGGNQHLGIHVHPSQLWVPMKVICQKKTSVLYLAMQQGCFSWNSRGLQMPVGKMRCIGMNAKS